MIENRDYHKDVEIDITNLGNEWVEQPSLYLYYAEALADAIDTRDRAKQKLEVDSAELDQGYRKHWDELHPDTKMTETALKANILQDKVYAKSVALLNKASHNVNLLTSARSAFEHRKKALENLVSLHITGFHSNPKSPVKKMEGIIQENHTKILNENRRKHQNTKTQKTKKLKRK